MRAYGALVLLCLIACDDERPKDDDGGGLATSGSPGPTGPGSGPGSGPSTGSGSGDAHTLCFDLINQYRASIGVPPYTRWVAVEGCSDGEAQSDSMTMQAHGAFGTCGENAQNECPGWPGPADQMIGSCLESMWGEGPGGGHYENMASTDRTEAACGFFTLANGEVWSVQNFH